MKGNEDAATARAAGHRICNHINELSAPSLAAPARSYGPGVSAPSRAGSALCPSARSWGLRP